MNKNVLVVAPHCDDEVLGCGGTISKYADKGDKVYIAVITNGNLGAPEIFSEEGTKKVREEARKAHNILGVKETFFLDFPAPRLDTIASYKLAKRLHSLIEELQIETLYIPHRGDIHIDHRITYDSALVAARPVDGSTVKEIYAYETLSETEWAPPFGDDAFIPTVFGDIENFIKSKVAAFECFTTQTKESPHPRSPENIERLAKLRGSTVSLNFAEAFMLVREIK